jgi:DNA polymerase (family 10)
MNKNAEVARILREIAFLLEMEEDSKNKRDDNNNSNNSNTKTRLGDNNNNAKHRSNVSFKVRSYRRASDVIATLSSNIGETYRSNGLDGLLQIPSIGKAIGSKIQEYLSTGKIEYLKKLSRKQL